MAAFEYIDGALPAILALQLRRHSSYRKSRNQRAV